MEEPEIPTGKETTGMAVQQARRQDIKAEAEDTPPIA